MQQEKQSKIQPAVYEHVHDFIKQFDGFIVDLWGVLHDGTTPYPYAIEALKTLRNRNKQVILLSNAPRQAHKAQAVLHKLGFNDDLYDHLLTSGQAAHDYLAETNELGSDYYYVGPPKDEDIIANLAQYTRVDDPNNASFTLVTGFDNFGDGMDTKLPEVEACLAAKLPMICANPDRRVVKQSGEEMLCAGLLGEWYEQHGGEVTWFGKPYPLVYARVLSMFSGLKPANICAIGDSLHTDIAGAAPLGIHTVLTCCGILAQPLGITPGELPDDAKLTALCEQEQITPDAIMAWFR